MTVELGDVLAGTDQGKGGRGLPEVCLGAHRDSAPGAELEARDSDRVDATSGSISLCKFPE